jgi:predicted HNH restriction endonuclease
LHIYDSDILRALAEHVFQLYVVNYKSGLSTLYSIVPAENRHKLHFLADEIGMSRGSAENYSERLFNLFNELNGFDLHNGLQKCTQLLETEGRNVFDVNEFLVTGVPTTSSFNENLDKTIKESQKSSREQRRIRLDSANKKPKEVRVIGKQFVRNADVIVETLIRANGFCDWCEKTAPFNRSSNGSPYLEVHHINPLSQGGDDTLENTVALCPNCHREAHFGQKA